MKTFGELKSATLVRHAFRKEFSKTNQKSLNHVFRIRPLTIVEDFSAKMDPHLIIRSCASTGNRFGNMRNEQGRHFEH